MFDPKDPQGSLKKCKNRTDFLEQLDNKCLKELEEQPCLIQAFFAHEAEKPSHLRKTSCMISCPCPHCSPVMM
jgi:hypothetical protein